MLERRRNLTGRAATAHIPRVWLEPRRLFWRYFTTNPRALYLLFNYSRSSDWNQKRHRR